MIVYALIIRSKDGLPLSARTDFSDEVNRNIKDNKKYVKLVGTKAAQVPEKCVLQLKDYTIYMITCVGVSYLVMTEFHYPAALAFSFLNDLMREFIQLYDSNKVNTARRPYQFIEFDSYIHKTRQAYNKPQNLASRVNLSDLNTELKLRPPYQLSLTDVEPYINGNKLMTNHLPQLGVGPPPKLEPMPSYAWVAVIFSVLLILLGLYRGFMALHKSSIEEYDGPSPIHGFIYLLESLFRAFQVHLLLYNSKFRILESWLCTLILFLCIFFLWELRDPSQHGVFALSTVTTHLCIITRKLQHKLPDYHV
uniref:Putative sec22 vesicle trafficking protein-like 2 n=1 Tax=Panstrongylus megistus TaxID=65343 RepID=A0A069DSH3_9HEMI